jgi:hypothetical protein
MMPVGNEYGSKETTSSQSFSQIQIQEQLSFMTLITIDTSTQRTRRCFMSFSHMLRGVRTSLDFCTLEGLMIK